MDEICAAAVLVHAGPGVEGRGVLVRERPIGSPAHHHVPAIFLGPKLQPVGGLACQRDLPQADGLGDDELARDGRAPRAVGADGRSGQAPPPVVVAGGTCAAGRPDKAGRTRRAGAGDWFDCRRLMLGGLFPTGYPISVPVSPAVSPATVRLRLFWRRRPFVSRAVGLASDLCLQRLNAAARSSGLQLLVQLAPVRYPRTPCTCPAREPAQPRGYTSMWGLRRALVSMRKSADAREK